LAAITVAITAGACDWGPHRKKTDKILFPATILAVCFIVSHADAIVCVYIEIDIDKKGGP
jgi:hypothetical protein